MTVPKLLSVDDVRRVAHLARLRPSDAEIEGSRAQLARVLDYVAQLQELDVEGVEPLTHPGVDFAEPLANRLEADDPQPPLPFAALQRNAPAMEGRFLAVPKIIGDGAEGG